MDQNSLYTLTTWSISCGRRIYRWESLELHNQWWFYRMTHWKEVRTSTRWRRFKWSLSVTFVAFWKNQRCRSPRGFPIWTSYHMEVHGMSISRPVDDIIRCIVFPERVGRSALDTTMMFKRPCMRIADRAISSSRMRFKNWSVNMVIKTMRLTIIWSNLDFKTTDSSCIFLSWFLSVLNTLSIMFYFVREVLMKLRQLTWYSPDPIQDPWKNGIFTYMNGSLLWFSCR